MQNSDLQKGIDAVFAFRWPVAVAGTPVIASIKLSQHPVHERVARVPLCHKHGPWLADEGKEYMCMRVRE